MAKSKQHNINRVIRAATKAGFRIEIIPLDEKIVIYTNVIQNNNLDRKPDDDDWNVAL